MGKAAHCLKFCLKALLDLVPVKKVIDLPLGGRQGVRAVDGVFPQALGIQFAQSSLEGLGGVGRAHNVAVFLHGVFSFQHHQNHRRGSHKGHQFAKKGALLVFDIKALGLLAGKVCHFEGGDPQSLRFKTGDNVANVVV